MSTLSISAPTPINAADAPYDYHFEDKDSELRQFFIALHSSKSSQSVGSTHSRTFTPISRAGSGFADSDSEDEDDIFALDRDDYDFEAHLPIPMLNSIRDMLDEPDPVPKESNRNLNPNAAPFVPNATHNHALATSAPAVPPGLSRWLSQPAIPSISFSQISGLLSQPPHRSIWTSIFASACLHPPTVHEIFVSHARDLVHSRLWNADALAELAEHFCWKAFCPQVSTSNWTPAATRAVAKESLAPFAVQVYHQLCQGNDEETAAAFVWHLKESVLGTFKTTWCTSESSKAISYRQTPSHSYVESGIALVSFIGDLFYARLFEEPQIGYCLSILTNELCSLEHIAAVRCLIKHAQALFWCYQPDESDGSNIPPRDSYIGLLRKPKKSKIKAFLEHFLTNAAALSDGNSVLCRTVVPGEREQIVREVVEMLIGWGRCEGFWDDGGQLIHAMETCMTDTDRVKHVHTLPPPSGPGFRPAKPNPWLPVSNPVVGGNDTGEGRTAAVPPGLPPVPTMHIMPNGDLNGAPVGGGCGAVADMPVQGGENLPVGVLLPDIGDAEAMSKTPIPFEDTNRTPMPSRNVDLTSTLRPSEFVGRLNILPLRTNSIH